MNSACARTRGGTISTTSATSTAVARRATPCTPPFPGGRRGDLIDRRLVRGKVAEIVKYRRPRTRRSVRRLRARAVAAGDWAIVCRGSATGRGGWESPIWG